MGLSHQSLSHLVEEEKLIRVGRGMYIHPEGGLGQDIDYQVACLKFGPKSVIGGLTALFHYNLIEQVPGQVWILVPLTQTTHTPLYRLIRSKTRLDREIIHEKSYRIVSFERAVLEGLKMASKIGERTAVQAARTALATQQTTGGSVIKSLFFFGVSSGYLKVNVTSFLPKLKMESHLTERYLTEEEVFQMITLTKNKRGHLLLKTIYSAGLRVSE